MKKIPAIKLAEFILDSYPDKDITPMKLQKLAYYAKVWAVVAGNLCIDAQFERWDYGPVNRDIFYKYKRFSKRNIPAPTNAQPAIQRDDAEFLRFILDNYVGHSAVALSAMTHKESPWADTPANEVISDQAICDYYSKRSFARNFQGKSWRDGPFYVMKTNSWYSFTMDMTDEEAEMYETYSSHAEYQKRIRKADADFDDFVNSLF